MDDGMISKVDDPTHKQKAIYSLTAKSIALVPVFAQLGAWGRRFMPASPELSIRAQLLEEGSPAMWEDFMEKLRETHLGIPASKDDRVSPTNCKRHSRKWCRGANASPDVGRPTSSCRSLKIA